MHMRATLSRQLGRGLQRPRVAAQLQPTSRAVATGAVLPPRLIPDTATVKELQHAFLQDVDIDTLTQQLQDAEAERDMWEALLLESEEDNRRLQRHVQLLRQHQHRARDLLQQLSGTLTEAKRAAEEERMSLLQDRLDMCGRIPGEVLTEQLDERHMRGVQRLAHYSDHMSNLTGSVTQLITHNLGGKDK